MKYRICPYCKRDLTSMQGLRRAHHFVECLRAPDGSPKGQDRNGLDGEAATAGNGTQKDQPCL